MSTNPSGPLTFHPSLGSRETRSTWMTQISVPCFGSNLSSRNTPYHPALPGFPINCLLEALKIALFLPLGQDLHDLANEFHCYPPGYTPVIRQGPVSHRGREPVLKSALMMG